MRERLGGVGRFELVFTGVLLIGRWLKVVVPQF
jgi:hypothetical protein